MAVESFYELWTSHLTDSVLDDSSCRQDPPLRRRHPRFLRRDRSMFPPVSAPQFGRRVPLTGPLLDTTTIDYFLTTRGLD